MPLGLAFATIPGPSLAVIMLYGFNASASTVELVCIPLVLAAGIFGGWLDGPFKRKEKL